MQEKHEVIKERLRFVRERMKTENVDIFVVFTDDYHMSEYSGAYFADRGIPVRVYRLCGNFGSDTDRSSTFYGRQIFCSGTGTA